MQLVASPFTYICDVRCLIPSWETKFLGWETIQITATPTNRRFMAYYESLMADFTANDGTLVVKQIAAPSASGGWSPHPMQDGKSICCLGLARAVTDD